MKLCDLKNGESAVITKIDFGGEKTSQERQEKKPISQQVINSERRFTALGLTVGATVKFIRRAPIGDPIEIQVRRTHIAIRCKDARLISVRKGAIDGV